MRKASKHSAILLLIGVFALGLLGAAYTLWYENLSLNASVSTGTFDADLSLHDPNTGANSTNGVPVVGLPPAGFGTLTSGVASFLDGGPRHFHDGASGYENFTEDNFNTPQGVKPKPTCDGVLTNDQGGQNGNGQLNTLVLNLGNLFPYAGCEFEIDITNDGTVPLHFAITKIDLWQCTGYDTGCTTRILNGWAPWSTGLDPIQNADPQLNAAQLAECAAWLGNTFGMIVDGNTLVHGFNGGSTGWDDFQQINTPMTSPFASNPGFPLSSAALENPSDEDAVPVQLHAGESLNCKFKIILDQNPDAEGKFYQFKAEYIAYQWNEMPSN